MDANEIERLRRYDIEHIVHPQFHRADHDGAVIYESGSGRGAARTSRATSTSTGCRRCGTSRWGTGGEELAEAAAEQMAKLAFSNAYTGYANVPSIKLTEKLLALAYPNMWGVFYANSGSEANDFAMKAARYFWFVRGKPEKVKIISRDGGVPRRDAGGDGDYGDGAVSQGLRARSRRSSCACRPAIRIAARRAAADRRASRSAPTSSQQAIEREGAETVAAVIAEPVHGAGGVIPPCEWYWPRLREICDRHDVLLIADEVITGFGRTGRWFALEHWGVQPDMMTFAKAVTSAYVPLSGFIMSERVHGAILDAPADAKFMIGCTNSAHPGGVRGRAAQPADLRGRGAGRAGGDDGRAAARGAGRADRDAERRERAGPGSDGGGGGRGGQGVAAGVRAVAGRLGRSWRRRCGSGALLRG